MKTMERVKEIEPKPLQAYKTRVFRERLEWVKEIEPKPLQAYKTRVFRERLERVKGIEPSYAAWEAAVLPLNYTRKI
jgi:hypothetical protein